MKMKYTDILLASVAALVFLGCDGDGVPEPDTEGNALQLRSVELSDPSVTRALGDGAPDLDRSQAGGSRLQIGRAHV